MEKTTLASLLDWRSIGPGRKRMGCPRCGMAIELRLLDDLLEVACPGCGAGPFFERARDFEDARGSAEVRQQLCDLGVLTDAEAAQVDEAAGPPTGGGADRRDFVGAARALGFFHKSLFLAHAEGTPEGLMAKPLRALITADQLREAVDLERAEGRAAGDVLGDLVLAGEKERLRQDLGELEIVDLDALSVPAEVRAQLPAAVAASLLAIPVRLEGDSLVVAVRDPLDFAAIDALKFHTGREIATVAAPEEALFRALERLYPEDAAAEDDDLDDDDLALLGDEPPSEAAEVDDGAERGIDLDDDRVPDMPEEAPGERTLEALLAQAVEQRAALVLLEPLDIYYRARIRQGRRLRDAARLSRRVGEAVVERAMVRAGLDATAPDEPQLGQIEVPAAGVTLDVAYAPQPEGATLAFRTRETSQRPLTLEGLTLVPGDAQLLRAALHGPPGLTVIAAPPGEGRSTLLAALARESDRTHEQVVLLERQRGPRLEGVVQLAADRYDALAGILDRLRPDRAFIDDLPPVLGGGGGGAREVRLALDLALTGARVFVATAAPDALSAVERLAATGVERRLLASAVRCLVDLRLVRRVCPRCRVDFAADPTLSEELGLAGDAREMAIGIGCWECSGSGYRGRSALVETVPIAGAALREALLGLDAARWTAAARAEGHRSLADKARFAMRAGLTSVTQVEPILLAGAGG